MKRCLIEFSNESVGIGDVIATLPYLEKFRTSYDFEVFLKLKNVPLSNLFCKSFPNIKFIPIGSEIDYDKRILLKHIDHNLPLQQIFAKQLGFINAPYIRPIIDLPGSIRQIKNKYICIGTHSTSQLKFWNHPDGVYDHQFSSNWNDLCAMLRKAGYTPICVDFYQDFGTSPFYNFVPVKSVKKLGLNLEEVLKLIEHCEFFIGLSSGLSWLAHAAGKPVCMISNFTEDWHEIDLSVSDYIRVTNKSVCHGCWNLVGKEFEFDYTDWYWCPRHKDTDRQFECHKSITPGMVLEKIKMWIN